MKKITLLLVSSFLLAMDLLAGGYQVRLQGNKQNGMGLVGTSLRLGSSSVFYNPGALSLMPNQFHFEVGGSAILSHVDFQLAGTNSNWQTDNPMGTPFYFYGAAKLNDWMTLGLGIYTPYGSSAKWDDDWAGKFLIQNISLQAIFFQPTLSVKIGDKLGLGAGFVYAMGDVELNKALNYGADASVNLNGSTNTYGFNLGAYYQASEQLSIGLNYRSNVSMSMEGGTASFIIPQSLSTTIPTANRFSAELPLPANLDFGIAYQVNSRLLLAVELDWVMWGAYESLDFTFEEQGDLLNSVNPREFSDSYIPRIGGEYTVSESLTVRAGMYYDRSPSNEDYFTPETVSLNTFAYTLGFSYRPTSSLSIDASFLQLFGGKAERTYQPDNFGGTYQANTIIPGMGVSFHF